MTATPRYGPPIVIVVQLPDDTTPDNASERLVAARTAFGQLPERTRVTACQGRTAAAVVTALAGVRDPAAAADGEACCRVCGCTENAACAGGCYWVPDPLMLGDLCSACRPVPDVDEAHDLGDGMTATWSETYGFTTIRLDTDLDLLDLTRSQFDELRRFADRHWPTPADPRTPIPGTEP